MQHLLAYDLGTGGNKASLYDAEGKLIASTFHAYETLYPHSGWHEQRPNDWWNAIVQSTRELLEKSDVAPESIAALAISGHSLGCVPLDASGELLLEATPIWSDSRPAEQADWFFQTQGVDAEKWYSTTGNGFPAPHYTLFKLLWYRQNEPAMFDKLAKFVGTKDYINYRMTGRIATDFSYASGCGAYDLTAWDYCDAFLDAADLSRDIFPELLPSTEVLGPLTAEAAAELGLPQSVQVIAGGVDNSCMALGARNTAPGRLYASLGSSSWIAVSDTKPLLDVKTKPYVFTHVIPEMFTSAIGVFSTGTAMRWVRDVMCRDLTAKAEQTGKNVYELMCDEAADSPVGAKGLLFNPSLAGGSSLEPSSAMRGGLLRVDLLHSRADVIRATLEGVALNLRKALDALRQLSQLDEKMTIVGGGSLSPLWRSIYASAFGMNVERTNIGQEAAALGAAALAAVGAGVWSDFSQVDVAVQTDQVVAPEPEAAAKYDALLPAFCRTAEMLAELA